MRFVNIGMRPSMIDAIYLARLVVCNNREWNFARESLSHHCPSHLYFGDRKSLAHIAVHQRAHVHMDQVIILLG
jgi:hypothetical protein